MNLPRRQFLASACAALIAPVSGQGQDRRLTVKVPGTSARGHRVLRSVGGVPPHIVGNFRDPLAFQQSASGQYFVFDRQGHSVYGIDRALTASWPIVRIGHEAGRLLEPTAFDSAPNGTFVVADRPAARERIQLFASGGALLGGFTLPGRSSEMIVMNGVVLNGVGSLQYNGRTLLINQPETGALVSEYSPSGTALRTFGTLRPTGHESDRDLHLALNSGLPLIDPRGGFYFVFQAGVPLFRRYDATGVLLFERHIEGPELDETLKNMPSRWPRRKAEGGTELPVVPPLVRTAAVDAEGNLWVSLASLPYTFVYDPSGEKAQVVQFEAAGTLSPVSLFFAPSGRLLVAPGCYEFNPAR
jgi:hypothetical protein